MATRGEAAKATDRRVETALITLLTAKPYGAITIADIAREADVSVRTVQRHYRTKDDLLAACNRVWVQMCSDEWARRPMPQSVEEGIGQLAQVMFISFYDRHGAELWAAYSRPVEVPELRRIVDAGIAECASHSDDVMRRWPEAWAVDKELARRTMLALTSFLTWRAFTEYSGFSTPEATKTVTDLLCRSLLL